MISPNPVVLTVAGYDPSGGAGIIIDVRTIVEFGCRPAAAITSLTFQNSAGVFGATHEPASSLRAQIVPVTEEHEIAAVKIGMIPTAELIFEIAAMVHNKRLPSPIVDPVLRSSSGYQLIDEDAIEVLRTELFPLARLITPNIPEAERLTGMQISDEHTMREAARRLRELGALAVLIKGGHLEHRSAERQAIDLLDDEGEITVFRGEWIDAPPVRGTGCMLSSAIAASLANGADFVESVEAAKKYVTAEIRNSKFQN
ncbi:MAG TPA: bifunctional hydroxymethylpyrimidine kinase/phosphomethylpyrimidine kinase [Pyrinomonadaceae bacterium]|nr:bifunctional hydroxymethylpyrimidine kinase/phosphomethylpyrimidine kinase [Pyrinomonadaceae bacterium]